MKVAKLPNGKTLRFPSEVSDEAIDQVVRECMKDHIAMSKHEKEQKQKSDTDTAHRHNQLLNAMQQVVHSHGVLLNHATQGHKEIMGALKDLAKAQSKPKKRRAIRDEHGKLIGAEEYD